MKPVVWQRVDLWTRNLTPFLISVFMVLVSIVPLHIADFARVAPALSLIAVYHWTVYRPELMPAVAVFALGLLQDLLGGGPVGGHALLLLVVHGGVLSQRRFLYGKSFAVAWIGFVAVASAATVMAWALISGHSLMLLSPSPFLFQYLLTIALFPLASWLLGRWERLALRDET